MAGDQPASPAPAAQPPKSPSPAASPSGGPATTAAAAASPTSATAPTTTTTTTTETEGGIHVTDTGAIQPAPAQPDDEAADEPGDDVPDDSDADSAFGSDTQSSTASISASIMEYRTMHNRTYHSERHQTEYFTPNDDQQLTSVDLSHHYLTLLLGGKLALPPLSDDIQDVLDVGTGTGIWAIDFADQYPSATIIGTDLSPIQPSWVPPNVKFEIDDCTLPWLYEEDKFDFIHMRFLFGGISDWDQLFREAYRCCRPGGYVQSAELDVQYRSDDDTIPHGGVIEKMWNPLFVKLGEKIGRSFTVVAERLQTNGLKKAGFEDIQEFNFKVPQGAWPQDPTLAEVGEIVRVATLNDLEGYTLFPYKTLMGDAFNIEEYHVWLAALRKEMQNTSKGKMHAYLTLRYVYGRKPMA